MVLHILLTLFYIQAPTPASFLLKPRVLLFLLSPPPSLFDPISFCDEFVSEMNNSDVGTTEEEEEEERELDVQSGSSDTLEILVF